MKNKIIFDLNDLFYKNFKKKKYIESIFILNTLTEKQKQAVELFGESKYSKGYDDGNDRDNYCYNP